MRTKEYTVEENRVIFKRELRGAEEGPSPHHTSTVWHKQGELRVSCGYFCKSNVFDICKKNVFGYMKGPQSTPSAPGQCQTALVQCLPPAAPS